MIIKVDGNKIAAIDDITFTAGVNVQQVMEAAYNLENDPAWRFMLQYFGSGLGYEVTGLAGLIQQAGSAPGIYLFWELLINGEFSQHGVDSTYPADGDQIEWN